MSNYVSAALLFVISCVAFAQERAVQDAPVEKADPLAIIAFGVIFFGMIIYFVWFVWRKDKDRQSRKDQQ